MIIPSIDIMNGSAVQLVEGRDKVIDAGDPMVLAERFARVGEIAVIDLDGAMGHGNNREIIEGLVRRFPCRVGGGIRDLETARRWLDRGARRVILGSAATPGLLRELPRDRVIVALDARDDEVMIHGWKTGTGESIGSRMESLGAYTSQFLVTLIEREGHMKGTDLDRARDIVSAAGSSRVTMAGGVTTVDEVAALDAMGADAQIGMAIYTGSLDLADAFVAPLIARIGDTTLWPTVVVDESSRALGLVWSTRESLRLAIEEGRGVYYSRSRDAIWRKGETSGATQRLLRVDLDCDRDAIRFTVAQEGSGFCHRQTRSCWGESEGLWRLEETLEERCRNAPSGSYAARLFRDPDLLNSKLLEEAQELVDAGSDRREVVHEAADVLFFTCAMMRRAGVTLADVERELDRRRLKITRRPGDSKSAVTKGGLS